MKRFNLPFLFFGTVISLIGCLADSGPSPRQRNLPPVLEEDEVGKRQSNSVRNAYQQIARDEAIDFVETWSKIYTTHTFDNYIRMYDREHFIGIKRTHQGERNTYDFAGWVSNKRNEFSKFRPEVFVEDVKVKYLNQNGKTKVSFIQKWYSTTSNYADQGEKVLILFKQNGEIFIEKEELLYSEPLYLEQGE